MILNTQPILDKLNEAQQNIDEAKAMIVALECGDPPPPTEVIDLLPYFMPPESVMYEMKNQDGAQERFQTQYQSNAVWYYCKNTLWERWLLRGDDICLEADVSPDPDSAGTPRYYKVFKDGRNGSMWAKRTMSIGETVTDGGHYVQFYAKSDCRALPENSGESGNHTTLYAYYESMTFTAGEHPITLNDVIEIGNDTERHWFAKGIGRVKWESLWGSSEISELHQPGTRPPYERENIPCMDNP